ncbi:MAG TPA: NUDIX hydrolase [Chitinophagaceae bacterium]|nr:NUDIX hydrolase [Chitinophagaceae bacterium]
MQWKILSSEYLYQHPPYFIARKDVCQRSDGHLIPAYYVVELPPSVVIFPVVDDKVLMIKQYRHPVKQISWELPGGFVDNNETGIAAAQRELEEETGYVFDNYKQLGKIAGNPGILNNFTDVFVATGSHIKGIQNFEINEEIEIQMLSFDEIIQMLNQNKIIQSLHANACYMALIHLGKLQYIK